MDVQNFSPLYRTLSPLELLPKMKARNRERREDKEKETYKDIVWPDQSYPFYVSGPQVTRSRYQVMVTTMRKTANGL